MKPEKAIQLNPASDFSFAAFEEMTRIVLEGLGYEPKLSFTLKVSSRIMGKALPLAYAAGCEVEIDFTYDSDEWSLTGYNPEHSSLTVWSPGA